VGPRPLADKRTGSRGSSARDQCAEEPHKGGSHVLANPSLAAVIAAQRDEQVLPRALSRRALEVSRSWFYKWPSDGRACGSAGPGVGDSPADGIVVLPRGLGHAHDARGLADLGGLGEEGQAAPGRRMSTPGLITAQWCWPASYRELAWDARSAGEMSDDWT
jgi:hypothetical protein